MIVDLVKEICRLCNVEYLEEINIFNIFIKTDSLILIIELVILDLFVYRLYKLIKRYILKI